MMPASPPSLPSSASKTAIAPTGGSGRKTPQLRLPTDPSGDGYDRLLAAAGRVIAGQVSEGGHDFRPSYLDACPVLALTTAATPKADGARVLALRDTVRVVGSFDRPNLSWYVTAACAQGQSARRCAHSSAAPYPRAGRS